MTVTLLSDAEAPEGHLPEAGPCQRVAEPLERGAGLRPSGLRLRSPVKPTAASEDLHPVRSQVGSLRVPLSVWSPFVMFQSWVSAVAGESDDVEAPPAPALLLAPSGTNHLDAPTVKGAPGRKRSDVSWVGFNRLTAEDGRLIGGKCSACSGGKYISSRCVGTHSHFPAHPLVLFESHAACVFPLNCFMLCLVVVAVVVV